MKRSVARAWVKALRSGKYKQGKGRLFTAKDRSYCCLGVLCSIAPSLGGPKVREIGELRKLPPPAQEFVGLRSSFGSLSGDFLNGSDSLAEANDKGVSFDEIATYISKHWKEL